MKTPATELYAFAMRGLLAEQALDRAGRARHALADFGDGDLAATLSLDLFDEALVTAASQMSVVYCAVAAFENSVRRLVAKVLLDHTGPDWWNTSVSSEVRKRAERRQSEEQKTKWHSQRGGDPITYSSLPDLINIIRANWTAFEPHIRSVEWASQLFDAVDRSRNVIMHSGNLERADIERLGVYFRDWIKQVGA